MNTHLVDIANTVVKLIGNPRQHKDKVLANADPILYARFIDATSFLPHTTKLSARIAHALTGIDSVLTCKVCGAEHTRLQPPSQRDYCSKQCYFSDGEAMKQRVGSVDQQSRVEKMAHTNLVKYGYQFHSQRPEIKATLGKSKLESENPHAVAMLNDAAWMSKQYQSLTSVEMSHALDVHYSTVLFYLRKHGIEIQPYANVSAIERSVNQFLVDSGIRTITSDRVTLGSREIDILVPDHNVAVEVNGLYWHSSEDYSNSAKHANKSIDCLKKGIQLIHVTDEKWLTKPDIVKSILLNKMGRCTNRIFARRCEAREIDSSTYRTFCVANHVNGHANASVKYGLFHDDVLVSVMSFSKSRYSNSHQWELIRMCSSINTSVVGGASKLFQHFIRAHQPTNVLTYADRQYGEGGTYTKIGFEYSYSTKPGYCWTDGNKSYNRLNFQKHKLGDLLDVFDNALSERQNMINNKYRMYFDCGNNVYVWSSGN